MKIRSFAMVLLVMTGLMWLAPVRPALSGPATREGASALKSVFETYLGRRPAGQMQAVTVTPAGESYRLSFDLRALAAPLAPLGITVTIAPYEMVLKPIADGLWQVAAGSFPPVHIQARSQTITMVFEGMRFEGTFDPKIKAFVVGQTHMRSMKLVSRAPGFENDRVDGPTTQTLTGVASGPGALSAVLQQSTESIRQVFRLTKMNPGGDAKPAMEVSALMRRVNMGLTIDSLRNDDLLGIWAFLVANPSAQAIESNFENLRGRLKAALPLFNSINQTAGIQDVTIMTPFGAVKAANIAGSVDVGGIRPDGHFAITFSYNGLSLPESVTDKMMPPWSKQLLPTKAVLDVAVSQFNLAAAANEILNHLRPGMPKPEIDALMKRAGMMVAPGGRVKVKIGASRLTSQLLDVEVSGDVDVNIPIPKVQIVARAKGLDETIKALQQFVTQDKKLQQAMLGMIAAKGFGKALPDGRMEWTITVDPAGTASVNGFKFPLPGRRKR